jgi:cytochrome c6
MKNILAGKRLTTVLLSTCLLISLSGWISDKTVRTENGKELYEINCSRCHGMNGTKRSWGAKNLQLSKIDSLKAMKTIRNGNFIMPAFKKRLTDEQINSVYSYIIRLRKV